MRSRVVSRTTLLAAIVLLGSAAACSFLRSLDDLGNGVRDEADAVVDGDSNRQDSEARDASGDARATCGPEVDLQKDPKNCGTCGAACLVGDMCESGTCTFAFVVGDVEQLAIGGG